MSAERIAKIETLLAHLEPTFIEVIDDSDKHIGHAGAKGGAGHFTLKISSGLFIDKSRIECHKMIYAALNDMLPQDIHALKIKIIS
jgi:BolA protein